MDNYTNEVMSYENLIAFDGTRLSYLQVVEKQGLVVCQSQRERNMINIMAAHQAVNPLQWTAAVMDKSQSIYRNALRADNVIGALATNASVFSFADGESLTTAEVAKLMGHQMERLNLDGISESKLRHMLGMPLHKTVAGLLLIGLLSCVGGDPEG